MDGSPGVCSRSGMSVGHFTRKTLKVMGVTGADRRRLIGGLCRETSNSEGIGDGELSGCLDLITQVVAPQEAVVDSA